MAIPEVLRTQGNVGHCTQSGGNLSPSQSRNRSPALDYFLRPSQTPVFLADVGRAPLTCHLLSEDPNLGNLNEIWDRTLAKPTFEIPVSRDPIKEGIQFLDGLAHGALQWGPRVLSCPAFPVTPRDLPLLGEYCQISEEEQKAATQCLLEIGEGFKNTLEETGKFSKDSHCGDYLACKQNPLPSGLKTLLCAEYEASCAKAMVKETFNIWIGFLDGMEGWVREQATASNRQDPFGFQKFQLAFIIALYNFLLGDSINILSQEQASCFAKSLAVMDIGLTFSGFGEAMGSVGKVTAKVRKVKSGPLKVEITSFKRTPQAKIIAKGASALNPINPLDARKLWTKIDELKASTLKEYRNLGLKLEEKVYLEIVSDVARLKFKFKAKVTVALRLAFKKPDLKKALLVALGIDSAQEIAESALEEVVMDKLQKIATKKMTDPASWIQIVKDMQLRADTDGENGFLISLPIPLNDQLSLVAHLTIDGENLVLSALEVCVSPQDTPLPQTSCKGKIVYALRDMGASFLSDRLILNYKTLDLATGKLKEATTEEAFPLKLGRSKKACGEGKWLVQNNAGLSLKDTKSAREKTIWENSQAGAANVADCSPDGQIITFVVLQQIRCSTGVCWQITFMGNKNAGEGSFQRLTTFQDKSDLPKIKGLAVSPKGDYFAYRMTDPHSFEDKLHILTWNGQRLAEFKSSFPRFAWISDEQLLYEGEYKMLSFNPNSRASTTIIPEPFDYSVPAADRKQIAYSTGGTKLTVVNADGSNRRIVWESPKTTDGKPEYSLQDTLQWCDDGSGFIGQVKSQKQKVQLVYIPSERGSLRILDPSGVGYENLWEWYYKP